MNLFLKLNRYPSKKAAQRLFDHIYHIASFLPGIGLTLGYIGACIATALSPVKTVEVFDEVAEWKETQIGTIPKWHFDFEPDRGSDPIWVKSPTLDADGKPIINKVSRIFHGKGKSTIQLKTEREIAPPYLGDPPFYQRKIWGSVNTVRRADSPRIVMPGTMTAEEKRQRTGKKTTRFHYLPNIQHYSTGCYERIYEVSFSPNFDPNSISIAWSIIGTVIGVTVFYLKEPFQKWVSNDSSSSNKKKPRTHS